MMKTAIKPFSQAHNEMNAEFKPRQQFRRHMSSDYVDLHIVTEALSHERTSFLNNGVICGTRSR